MKKKSIIAVICIAVTGLLIGIGDIVLSCEPPPPLECRVTGGGVDVASQWWNGSMAWGQFKKEYGGWDRYTFGGQAGAPTALQPQPYGEWTHHNQSGVSGSFVFHAGTASAPEGTKIDLIVCSDPGGCAPSGDPPSPCKQIYFQGVGTFKNIHEDSEIFDYATPGETLHRFEVHISDFGEPGKNGKQNTPGYCDEFGYADLAPGEEGDCDCADFYHIIIYLDNTSTTILYEVYGYITGGNLQIHHPVQ